MPDNKQLIERLRDRSYVFAGLCRDEAADTIERLEEKEKDWLATVRRVEAERERDAAVLEALTEGPLLIAEERARQVSEEGWMPEHDDRHENCELALAAMVYADPRPNAAGFDPESPPLWPFEREWYKPRDYRANLIRAGALVAAEIERIGRELVTREKNRALQHAQEQVGETDAPR